MNAPVLEGGCACGAVRYRLLDKPMFVHCCHCTWCQRETGAAFALNAIMETDRVELLEGSTEEVYTPSASGKGQLIHRCPECKVAVWSHYGTAGRHTRLVRVGTLDDSAAFPPNVHIFTSTKLPWLNIDDGRPAFEEFYRYKEHWPEESYDRFRAVLARHRATSTTD